MRTKRLLFFVSDDATPSAPAVIPTLARLAKEEGLDFESYICTRPWSWQGEVLPAVGNGHVESFYFLANFYEEILYCSLTNIPSYPFRRAVLAFGGKVLSSHKKSETLTFYREVFAYFGRALPDTVIVVPSVRKGERNLAPFCYPDIVRLGALGIEKNDFIRYGGLLCNDNCRKYLSLYCSATGTEPLDEVQMGDTYGSITERIAERNSEEAKQIGFIDPSSLLRWETDFIRKSVLPLYQDYEWEAFIPVVKRYADKIGNRIIDGTQVVYEPRTGRVRNNDAVITALAQQNLILNLLGVNPRIGFTVQKHNKLPRDWMDDPSVPTPWDDEFTDEELLSRMKQGGVPVCFIFYAADLGHLPVLTQFLNLACLDGMRAGIAFPSTWYEYCPELLEMLYLPLKQGGVCPNLEPLISSVGIAVATEAEGFITPDFLTHLLSAALDEIRDSVGERRVPHGYYPFQDASPFYKKGVGKPQFDVIARLGFEYYVTYLNSEAAASVEYDGNGMIALNQQTPQWFPGYGNPLNRLKEWEQKCVVAEAPQWITFGFDTPFFALTPNYLGEIEYDDMRLGWAKHTGMHEIYRAMQYVRRNGGESGKLFLVKPHELARFARLARVNKSKKNEEE